MATDTGAGQVTAKIKAGAHWLAAGIAAGLIWAGHFVASSAGQAFVAQYPKVAAAAGVITAGAAAAGVYFRPR
jgi:hypothetical protein